MRQGQTVSAVRQLALTAHCLMREHRSQQLPRQPSRQSPHRVRKTSLHQNPSHQIHTQHWELPSSGLRFRRKTSLFLSPQMLLMLLYWVTCRLTCWDLRWSRGVWRSVRSFAGSTTDAPLNDRMLFMVGQFFLLQCFIWALCTTHTISAIVKQILLVELNVSGWSQRTILSQGS